MTNVNLDLQKMGLVELDSEKVMHLQGGLSLNPVQWLIDYAIGKVVDAAISSLNPGTIRPMAPTPVNYNVCDAV